MPVADVVVDPTTACEASVTVTTTPGRPFSPASCTPSPFTSFHTRSPIEYVAGGVGVFVNMTTAPGPPGPPMTSLEISVADVTGPVVVDGVLLIVMTWLVAV